MMDNKGKCQNVKNKILSFYLITRRNITKKYVVNIISLFILRLKSVIYKIKILK